MSPTENDLRAALRAGEGDGPDPSRVVAAGQRARARRRTQLVNAAVAVALIGGLGTLGALVLSGGGNDSAGNSSDLGAAKAPRNALRTGGAGAPAGGSSAASAIPGARSIVLPPQAAAGTAPSCPDTAPSVPAPGAGGGTGPLFTGHPSELIVCTYASASGPKGATKVVLKGADAQAVVASLEAAPTTKPSGMCPQYRLADERTVRIIGRTASGKVIGTVTTTLDRPPCATVVTNGSDVRYAWTPPGELTREVGPRGGRSHGPVGPAASPSR